MDYKSTGIQNYIFDRLCQIHEEIICNDLEFQELGEKWGEVLNRLYTKLCPEDQVLLDEYDCSRTDQMNRQDELVYTQGLMDGMIFGYWVMMVSLGMERISV